MEHLQDVEHSPRRHNRYQWFLPTNVLALYCKQYILSMCENICCSTAFLAIIYVIARHGTCQTLGMPSFAQNGALSEADRAPQIFVGRQALIPHVVIVRSSPITFQRCLFLSLRVNQLFSILSFPELTVATRDIGGLCAPQSKGYTTWMLVLRPATKTLIRQEAA